MAFTGNCAHCGSFDVMAGQDMYQCLQCGLHTDRWGNPVAPRPPTPATTWFGRRNIDGPESQE